MPSFLRLLVVASSATLSLLAQAGNEVVFVGTSTSGSVDTHAFVESGTGTLVAQGPSSFTDNVTDAVWTDVGRTLYVGQSLQNRVSRAQWNGSTAQWSSFYPAPGACYGLGLDGARKRLWVLTGAGSNRELHCVDADPASPGYGTMLAQTSVLGGASRERWGLSWTGNLAAVPHVFLSSGLFEIVDTDPASPTFLQVVVSTPVPGLAGSSFTFAADCEISIDEAYAYVLYSGIGVQGVGVYDLAASAWLDFDGATPGQQHLAIALPVPNGMALSLDRAFAVVSGQAGGGWAARIDFDYATPANTTFTQYPGLVIPNANAISLSPDNGRAAVTSTPQQVAPPGTLVVFDVATGAVLQTVPLGSMWNIYTTAWQDASPAATYLPFGSGCSGSLGTPTLAAAPGSRPTLGTTFTAIAGNLPFGIAVLEVGLSSTFASGTIPLPLPLDSLGMTGCALLVDPMVPFALVETGTSAAWSWTLPSDPLLFGAQFFSQAFPLDPAANTFGFTASNGTVGTLGY